MNLMVDFNQGLQFGEALERCHAIDDLGLAWIEEPIVYDNLEGYARLTADLKTPVQIGENFYGAGGDAGRPDPGAIRVRSAASSQSGSGAGGSGARRHGRQSRHRPKSRAAAEANPATANPPPALGPAASWFADWAAKQAIPLAGSQTGSVRVQTSLVPQLQNLAQQVLDDALARQGRELGVSQGALFTVRKGDALAPDPDHAHVETIATHAAGGKRLPAALAAQIAEKTDGVPLFVEELTKAILESGVLREEGDRYELTGPIEGLSIPTTLNDALMAWLDRLSGAKQVAQTAAIIGREFSYELLRAVTSVCEDELGSALRRLAESELIFQRGDPPQARYTFKQALIRDAAYHSLLRANRRVQHRRVAEALEKLFPETAETQPELLAYHYTEAAFAKRAITYWRTAGQQSARRAANIEAIEHFRRGLAMLEALPDRAAHANEELTILLALGPALMSTRTSAAPEIQQAYDRALGLARDLGKVGELFTTVSGSWVIAGVSGKQEVAHAYMTELFSIARKENDAGYLLQAHHCGWSSSTAAGNFISAHEHIEAGLALYDKDAHRAQAVRGHHKRPADPHCQRVPASRFVPTHDRRKRPLRGGKWGQAAQVCSSARTAGRDRQPWSLIPPPADRMDGATAVVDPLGEIGRETQPALATPLPVARRSYSVSSKLLEREAARPEYAANSQARTLTEPPFPAAFGAATRRLARVARGRRGAAANGAGGSRGLTAKSQRVVPRRRRAAIRRAFSIGC
jgi:tetratricopeptide (TPR) repeat protein